MTTGVVRPIKVYPRLDPKPWGGRRLEALGIALPPDEAIGEALLTAPEAVVVSGDLQGALLGDLACEDPDTWIGARGLAATGGRRIFPLLIKLIDGHADLSIQVHPDDRAAAAAGLGTGKTEAYHLLSAEPGSVIFLGLDEAASQEHFAASCRRVDGSAARCLRRVPANPGMTVLIPAGTLHALGAGITLYEIQQPSNVTFRLDDWGRVDASGSARPLHLKEGLAVIDPDSRPESIPRVPLGAPETDRAILVATAYFALERIAFTSDATVRIPAVESPQVLTSLAGQFRLAAGGADMSAATGETIVLPAGLRSTLTGGRGCLVMRGWVPDLERDVIAPARAAGASGDAIRRLGVPEENLVS